MILQLEEGGRILQDLEDIKVAIYNFYKQLFGKQKERSIGLAEEIWPISSRLSREDSLPLIAPFTEDEVLKVTKELKINSAPGPNGFIPTFYKFCWSIVREDS